MAALLAEIRTRARLVREQSALVGSIYFGGGTPTILAPDDLAIILDGIKENWNISPEAEITIEANPGTVSVDSLHTLSESGFNRISLGVQSFDDSHLRELGRIHSAEQAGEAIWESRRAGFANVSLDLMFGLPRQTVQSFGRDVATALAHSPDHLSLYALTIEDGTPFGERARQGCLELPSEDAAADMYCLAEEMLESAGYCHYEISNWAGRRIVAGGDATIQNEQERGLENWLGHKRAWDHPRTWAFCRHNLVYWRSGEYIGVGAGAHSNWQRHRFGNETSPTGYIEQVEDNGLPVVSEEDHSAGAEMSEYMMLGLRIADGISHESFESRFGRQLHDVFGCQIGELRELGLLECATSAIWLTPRGRLLGNEVFVRFLV